jgi:DedD protein
LDQKALEIPRSAADVVPPKAQNADKAASEFETGYRIVPLDDGPSKPSGAGKPDVADQRNQAAGGPGDRDDSESADTAAASPQKGRAPSAARRNSDGGGYLGDSAASPPQNDEAGALQDEDEPPVPADKRTDGAQAAKIGAGKPAPRDRDSAGAKTIKTKTGKGQSEPSNPEAGPETVKRPTSAGLGAAGKQKLGKQGAATSPPGAPAAAEVAKSWTIQAGTFNAEDNARSLVDKLRKQNLPASLQVNRSGAQPVFRVTVGPELNRSRAEQMKRQIEASVGVKAMILEHR